MRYIANYNAALGEATIEISGNCYTDAFPMLRQIIIRKQDVDLKSQSLALACAILTARYCGDQFEFAGTRIGNDYADAIRTIVGRETHIALVDGLHRTISLGEVDILCERASTAQGSALQPRPVDTVPFTRIDWSGDFVDARMRNSSQHAFGTYQTNAEFFADPMLVSIAIGLLHSRDRCRTLYVRRDERADKAQIAVLERALKSLAIALRVLD